MPVATIPKAGAGTKDENGIYGWEKTTKDVNNIDESFKNARDIGYLRLNYARNSVVGQLSKYDNQDIYKITAQSAGKLKFSIRSTDGDDEKVLDLSKYEEKINALKKQTDPVGWAREQLEKSKKEKEAENLTSLTAPGIRVQIYTLARNGKEVLVGDSHADKDSKAYAAMEKMISGDYRAAKGDYYVKITRDDTLDANKESAYALQMQIGKTYKHDYVTTEKVSDDTKNKTETKVPSVNTNGTLSPLNALQIQASKYQTTATMLAVGYTNMAQIYNKTSKY